MESAPDGFSHPEPCKHLYPLLLQRLTGPDRLTEPPQLLPDHVVLPGWRDLAHSLLLPFPPLPPLILALRQHSHSHGRSKQRPACQWHQHYVVDPGRFHLPVVHEALPFPLVATIQLSSLDGTGRRRHHWPHRHIRFPANAERWYQRQLVGQFGVAEYSGRADGSSEGSRSGSNIWTKYMVMILIF